MEFFRQNQKIIVGLIAISFLLFMFAPMIVAFIAK